MTTRLATLALAIALAAAAAVPAVAQQKPPLSPPGQAAVTIGAATITIDYARPSMRGRKIMGELVPYDKVWRTGANAATTLKTSAALEIGGAAVPAGTYTLYTLPGEKAWNLIINKQTGQWGTVYDQAQDLARVDLKVGATAAPVEQFTITLAGTGAAAGLLTMEWENTKLTIPFAVK
jgi:opacity protein-like surface antigen